MSKGTGTLKTTYKKGDLIMETIKVFLGMEIGRYDGYEFGKVVRTFDNDYKLVFIEGNIDEDGSWDSLWIAKPDDKFGWYGVDDLNIEIEFGNFKSGWLEKSMRFDR